MGLHVTKAWAAASRHGHKDKKVILLRLVLEAHEAVEIDLDESE